MSSFVLLSDLVSHVPNVRHGTVRRGTDKMILVLLPLNISQGSLMSKTPKHTAHTHKKTELSLGATATNVLSSGDVSKADKRALLWEICILRSSGTVVVA